MIIYSMVISLEMPTFVHLYLIQINLSPIITVLLGTGDMREAGGGSMIKALGY